MPRFSDHDDDDEVRVDKELDALQRLPRRHFSVMVDDFNASRECTIEIVAPVPELWLRSSITFRCSLPPRYPDKPPVVHLLGEPPSSVVRCCVPNGAEKTTRPRASNMNASAYDGPIRVLALRVLNASGPGGGGWSSAHNLEIVAFSLRSLFMRGGCAGCSSHVPVYAETNEVANASDDDEDDEVDTALAKEAKLSRVSPREGLWFKARSGSAELKGRRGTMEDAIVCCDRLDLDARAANFSFFGVFDGHGGSACSDFASRTVHAIVAEQLAEGATPREAIFRAFVDTDRRFLDMAAAEAKTSSSKSRRRRGGGGWDNSSEDSAGSTGVVALLDGRRRRLIVGNCGDSRAVLSRAGRAVSLTRDHKATRPDEVARIIAAGGVVFMKRVMGQLAVARALGDALFKRTSDGQGQLVTAEPEFCSLRLRRGDAFVILACDGLWDVMSSQDAVDFAHRALRRARDGDSDGDGGGDERDGGWGGRRRRPLDPVDAAARALVRHAVEDLHSRDNVSAVIILFDDGSNNKDNVHGTNNHRRRGRSRSPRKRHVRAGIASSSSSTTPSSFSSFGAVRAGRHTRSLSAAAAAGAGDKSGPPSVSTLRCLATDVAARGKRKGGGASSPAVTTPLGRRTRLAAMASAAARTDSVDIDDVLRLIAATPPPSPLPATSFSFTPSPRRTPSPRTPSVLHVTGPHASTATTPTPGARGGGGGGGGGGGSGSNLQHRRSSSHGLRLHAAQTGLSVLTGPPLLPAGAGHGHGRGGSSSRSVGSGGYTPHSQSRTPASARLYSPAVTLAVGQPLVHRRLRTRPGSGQSHDSAEQSSVSQGRSDSESPSLSPHVGASLSVGSLSPSPRRLRTPSGAGASGGNLGLLGATANSVALMSEAEALLATTPHGGPRPSSRGMGMGLGAGADLTASMSLALDGMDVDAEIDSFLAEEERSLALGRRMGMGAGGRQHNQRGGASPVMVDSPSPSGRWHRSVSSREREGKMSTGTRGSGEAKVYSS